MLLVPLLWTHRRGCEVGLDWSTGSVDVPHSGGSVTRTGEYAGGGIDGLDGWAIVDSEALGVENGNVSCVGELSDR